jgi:predicted DNA-binding transcriptional regulator AlpA
MKAKSAEAPLKHSWKMVGFRRATFYRATNAIFYGQFPRKPTGFLGAFTKFRKATISLVMAVCTHRTTRLPLDGFSLNLVFGYFSNFRRENSSFVKI